MTSVVEEEDGESGVQDPAETVDASLTKRQPSSGSLKDQQLGEEGRFVRSNKIIGHGSTKIVYKARDEEEGVEVAWNEMMDTRCAQQQGELIAKFKNEITILESLDHPNIITMYHSHISTSSKRALFISEMLPGGTLKEFIANSKKKRLNLKVSFRLDFLVPPAPLSLCYFQHPFTSRWAATNTVSYIVFCR